MPAIGAAVFALGAEAVEPGCITGVPGGIGIFE